MFSQCQQCQQNIPHTTPYDVVRRAPEPFPAPAPSQLTLSALLSANLHLGHSTSLWHPRTLPFVFGTRNNISIINLELTLSHLRRACAVTQEVAYRNGVIVFVGTRPGMHPILYKAATEGSAYCVTRRWVAGTITNASEILDRGEEMRVNKEVIKGMSMEDAETLGLAHRRSVGSREEGRDKRTPRFYRPDLLIVLNVRENVIALAETKKFGIPTIGMIDTDCDPTCVTYPIAGNDDSLRATELVVGVLAKAAKEGRKERGRWVEGIERRKIVARKE